MLSAPFTTRSEDDPHTARVAAAHDFDEEGHSPVDLFEYQARDLFEKHGVPVLQGIVATTPEEAQASLDRFLAGPGDARERRTATGGRTTVGKLGDTGPLLALPAAAFPATIEAARVVPANATVRSEETATRSHPASRT